MQQPVNCVMWLSKIVRTWANLEGTRQVATERLSATSAASGISKG